MNTTYVRADEVKVGDELEELGKISRVIYIRDSRVKLEYVEPTGYRVLILPRNAMVSIVQRKRKCRQIVTIEWDASNKDKTRFRTNLIGAHPVGSSYIIYGPVEEYDE